MSTVTIPSGGDSEPVVVIKVNGADVSQRVDVPFEADAALLAVLAIALSMLWHPLP